jgi:hypothetical protein
MHEWSRSRISRGGARVFIQNDYDEVNGER